MKSSLVALPSDCLQRIGPDITAQIVGVCEGALLAEPLLGLISSRECPGHVLRSVLRRKAGRVVKVLARGMSDYRPSSDEREPLATGRMLVYRLPSGRTSHHP